MKLLDPDWAKDYPAPPDDNPRWEDIKKEPRRIAVAGPGTMGDIIAEQLAMGECAHVVSVVVPHHMVEDDDIPVIPYGGTTVPTKYEMRRMQAVSEQSGMEAVTIKRLRNLPDFSDISDGKGVFVDSVPQLPDNFFGKKNGNNRKPKVKRRNKVKRQHKH